MLKFGIVTMIGTLISEVLQGLHIVSSMVYFVAAGVVPGTHYVVPADTMLLLWVGVLGVFTLLGLVRVARQQNNHNLQFNSAKIQ